MSLDIEDLDATCGFSRPSKKSPNLSVDAYTHHVFVVAPSDAWIGARDAALVPGVAGKIVQSLKAAKAEFKQRALQVKITFCDQRRGSDGGSSAAEAPVDVIVYPSSTRFSDVQPDHVESIVEYLTNGASVVPENLASISSQYTHQAAFICGHVGVDKRCGYCGPRIIDGVLAFAAERATPIDVYITSHIGGHAYAANLLAFPQGTHSSVRSRLRSAPYLRATRSHTGDWYGNVAPDMLPSLLELLTSSDATQREELARSLAPHWRGRIGLSEQQQKDTLAAWSSS